MGETLTLLDTFGTARPIAIVCKRIPMQTERALQFFLTSVETIIIDITIGPIRVVGTADAFFCARRRSVVHFVSSGGRCRWSGLRWCWSGLRWRWSRRMRRSKCPPCTRRFRSPQHAATLRFRCPPCTTGGRN